MNVSTFMCFPTSFCAPPHRGSAMSLCVSSLLTALAILTVAPSAHADETGSDEASAESMEGSDESEQVAEDTVADETALPELTVATSVGDRTISFTAYGMVLVNTVYNTGTPAPTQESPIGAVVGSGIDDELETDGSFIITPRQSRFGFRTDVDIDEDTDLVGRLEMDFFGFGENRGPGATTQTSVRLRHANMNIGGERWRFIAGQDWSLVTPRLPTSLSHAAIAVHVFSGVLFNRLPQLQVRNVSSLSDSFRLQTAVAVTRPHGGHGTGPFSRFDVPDPGARGGLPYLQGRIALVSDVFELGFAGHVGRERYLVDVGVDRTPGFRYGETLVDEQYVETWLASVDLRLTVGNFWLHTQGWTGANLTGLFGRQGIYVDRWRDYEDTFADGNLSGTVQGVEAISSFGGWAEMGLGLGNSDLTLVASAGGDFGDEADVDFMRVYRNIGFFGGLIYKPLPFLDASLEYYRTITYYRPDLEYRLQEDYREDMDPLRGEDAPRRMREGHNDSISFNLRFKF